MEIKRPDGVESHFKLENDDITIGAKELILKGDTIKASDLSVSDDFIEALTAKRSFIENINSIGILDVQELKTENALLTAKVSELESRLNKLEAE